MQHEGPLSNLIRMLAGLPGLGSRSGRRIALHLLARRSTVMLPLAEALRQAAEQVKECSICGNLDMHNPCGICKDPARERTIICVVAQVSDLWALERTRAYKGLYHVLGGVLSAIDGIGPAELRIAPLVERIRQTEVAELILALSATVDGQSTAHYVADQFNGHPVRVSRLAHGMPVGGELDYLDDGTITMALRARGKAT